MGQSCPGHFPQQDRGSKRDGFLLPRAEIHPKYSRRGRHCCFSSLSSCKTCLDSSWRGPGALLASEGYPSRACSPPVHPAGVEQGFAVGTSMGKRGTATHSVPEQDCPQGHKASCFPQVERESGSRSLGKVKYHPCSSCLTGEYQGLLCSAPAVPRAQCVL